MTTKGHKKHGKTVKTKTGNFGRMEIAIMGTPCGEIKELARMLLRRLGDFRLAYVDADHKTEEEDIPGQIKSGANVMYTDKIKFNRIDFSGPLNQYARNRLFNEHDLILVNGNHFEAAMQIVIVDERKPLEKKLEKITGPIAILRKDKETRLPEYLEKHLGKELEIQPIYNYDEVGKLADLIRDTLILNVPRINGLVLAGGKSERMGKDKGLIDYHGLPQREYVYQMLEGFTEKTFMSCRPDQANDFDQRFDVLPDRILGLGPYGAILSAFLEYPNHAWIVVACDIPLVDQKAISQLIESRNPSNMATAFFNEETGFPDPLLTIWEPKAYQELLHFLSLGYSCPRKVLINSRTEILTPADPRVLLNANSPEDLEKVLESIRNNPASGST
ncbi:MAG: NTP transferase domain-containing protein [Cytophagales bacterium]|nr:NTP transferase domain-containing protein [Cytophagales bacterium]